MPELHLQQCTELESTLQYPDYLPDSRLQGCIDICYRDYQGLQRFNPQVLSQSGISTCVTFEVENWGLLANSHGLVACPARIGQGCGAILP